jgi:hypothetical protein
MLFFIVCFFIDTKAFLSMMAREKRVTRGNNLKLKLIYNVSYLHKVDKLRFFITTTNNIAAWRGEEKISGGLWTGTHD